MVFSTVLPLYILKQQNTHLRFKKPENTRHLFGFTEIWGTKAERKMSGVTLAVGQNFDNVRPPGEETTPEATRKKQLAQPILGSFMGSLRVLKLQLVAFIIVFSLSGLVSLLDLVYPTLATIYCILLSCFAFPAVGSSSEKELYQGGNMLRIYVALGTVVGLFLPLTYVLGAFARGDQHAVRAATPHLFLLSCQILTENVVTALDIFSSPVRAIVPLLYTVRRIFLLVDWIYDVWAEKELSESAPAQDAAWVWFARVLATANIVYYSTNLLGFLIPSFLPRAFDKYFKLRDEISSKKAEEKRASATGYLIPSFLPRAFEKYLKPRDETSSKKAEDKRASAKTDRGTSGEAKQD